ncbi:MULTISPECIES: hypothetical protein [Chitinimonas]|uniref:Uncharacterized protein n=1 Tax=Chitinimonas prasina TaxID=1434937 RepID=A0ABQ5YF55_9NEIS|nr:hypothetical protein [Chitinimonas prasina]GLR11980.1 hypothetical protein GCM10007907_07700 [Chitinimonas prasina]
MFRMYLVAASLATALFGYGQYKGQPLFGDDTETRERSGSVSSGGRLYHK